ncbi:MAG: hydroxymethylbilane synthase [Betaproteobacteria bacterium]|nr:hydroxymethylbilane synthase [Betaproteobacteria bacterium]
MPIPERVVIATRESPLAMWQAHHVAQQLRADWPGLQVEILGMTTRGDQILDVSLSKIGGKGLFVKELEAALLEGRADIAVHSMKDVPMSLPDGFALVAIGEREDPTDALVSNLYANVASLPDGARVGTSSLRRESQLRAKFPHLNISPLRGNLQTRLRKLDEGQYEAIVLASAGLKRLDLGERIRESLSIHTSLPAVGQGALGIECLQHRTDLFTLLAKFNHADTADCVMAERSLSLCLGGSCQVPLGGYAEISGETLTLRGLIAQPDGSLVLREQISGARQDAKALGRIVGERLLAQGADKIMAALA